MFAIKTDLVKKVSSYIYFILSIILASCHQRITEEGSLNNYAIYCIKNNLWNEARFYLEKAKTLYPNSAKINNNLGIVYEYLGRKDEAILSYKKAISLDKEEVYFKNLAALSPCSIPKGLKNSSLVEKIRIEKDLPPSIDFSKTERIGLCISSEDKNLIPLILSAIKEQIIKEANFYIVYNESYPKTQEEIKNVSLKLLVDNILIIDILGYNVSDLKDFDVSTKFIKDENRYEFLRTYYTDRKATLSSSLSLFDSNGFLLFKKDFNCEEKKRYEKENPSIYDYSLILSFTKPLVSSFLSLITQKNYTIERWLVRD
ncbi:MAG: tetratricopeptide repeat protein [bacterium]